MKRRRGRESSCGGYRIFLHPDIDDIVSRGIMFAFREKIIIAME